MYKQCPGSEEFRGTMTSEYETSKNGWNNILSTPGYGLSTNDESKSDIYLKWVIYTS